MLSSWQKPARFSRRRRTSRKVWNVNRFVVCVADCHVASMELFCKLIGVWLLYPVQFWLIVFSRDCFSHLCICQQLCVPLLSSEEWCWLHAERWRPGQSVSPHVDHTKVTVSFVVERSVLNVYILSFFLPFPVTLVCMWMGSSQTWLTALSLVRTRFVLDFSLYAFPRSCMKHNNLCLFFQFVTKPFFYPPPLCPRTIQWLAERQTSSRLPTCALRPHCVWWSLATRWVRGGGRTRGTGLLYGMDWEAVFSPVTSAESWESALAFLPLCKDH